MNAIYSFFAKFVAAIYNDYESFALAIIIITGVFRLALSPIMNNHFKSLKLAPVLKPRIDAINEKYKHDEKQANKEIMELMNNVHYPYFGSAWNTVVEALIALAMTGACVHPNLYIIPKLDSGIVFSPKMLFIKDLTLSARQIVSGAVYSNGEVLYILLPLAAVVLKFYIDRFIREHTLVEREIFEYIMLTVLGVSVFVLPQIFALCWVVLELGNILHILYVNKFTNVRLVEKEMSGNKHVRTIDKKVIEKQKKRSNS